MSNQASPKHGTAVEGVKGMRVTAEEVALTQ